MNRLRLLIAVGVVFAWTLPAFAEFPSSQPFDGVSYRAETQSEPPQRLFIAVVDLTNPKVHLRVAPGGPDPDGPGQWETTLMPPTKIAAREGYDLVVNGDFFDVPNVKDAEGEASQYRSKLWAGACGPAVTEGKTWSIGEKKTPCLVVRKNRKVSFETIDKPSADAWAVIAGNRMMVEDGKAVDLSKYKARAPRTVLGLNRERTKLTIVAIDGRKKDAVGMSYAEISREMLRLGCWEALNLDGGGSTVMAFRDPANGEYRIVNQPTDGRERAVANAFGLTIGDRTSRAASPPKRR